MFDFTKLKFPIRAVLQLETPGHAVGGRLIPETLVSFYMKRKDVVFEVSPSSFRGTGRLISLLHTQEIHNR